MHTGEILFSEKETDTLHQHLWTMCANCGPAPPLYGAVCKCLFGNLGREGERGGGTPQDTSLGHLTIQDTSLFRTPHYSGHLTSQDNSFSRTPYPDAD